jgi:hypothetical protein
MNEMKKIFFIALLAAGFSATAQETEAQAEQCYLLQLKDTASYLAYERVQLALQDILAGSATVAHLNHYMVQVITMAGTEQMLDVFRQLLKEHHALLALTTCNDEVVLEKREGTDGEAGKEESEQVPVNSD